MLRVVEGLMTKLDVWFHEQAITHGMGIYYPQYWLQVDIKVKFPQHLEMNAKFFLLQPMSIWTSQGGKIYPYGS
jgi:hypothetical protein